jgi:putative phosphoesterase
MLVGLISDTHGLLRPEALRALTGVELILHAGDVGGSSILERLGTIARVQAVSGNVDPEGWLPAALDMELDGVRLHVSHGHEMGSPTPTKLAEHYAADVIVYGHTHRQLLRRIGRTLVVNPGAAGPRRFDVKPSIALLELPRAIVTFVDL